MVRTPAVSMRSFTTSGTPASGPSRTAARAGDGALLAERDDGVEIGVRGEAPERRTDDLLGAHAARAHVGGDLAGGGGGHQSRWAIASTSSSAPGTASRLTSTSVLAGRVAPKNASRTGLIRGRSSTSSR